jgi:hypothetical protein
MNFRITDDLGVGELNSPLVEKRVLHLTGNEAALTQLTIP